MSFANLVEGMGSGSTSGGSKRRPGRMTFKDYIIAEEDKRRGMQLILEAQREANKSRYKTELSEQRRARLALQELQTDERSRSKATRKVITSVHKSTATRPT